MEVWIVTTICLEIDGSNYLTVENEVFSTETRAREFFDEECDKINKYATEIFDDDEDFFTVYEEDTIPKIWSVRIEKKGMR